MYGQTEAGPRVAWLPHERVEAHPDCIGGPIPGVRMALDGGELVVEGPGVMLGYAADRADLALGDTLGGRLRTGDEAEQLGPDLFRVIGRRARFLKLQGNRVGLQEVEDGLREDGFEAACLGRDDLLVVCTTEASIERVRRAALARFSFPARSLEVRHVAALPRRDNGKLDYAALARQHAEEGERA
jgi:acyl-coenzyme A synthetase/AMP-(fatty) acid ligase